jgi:hypothetical protein
MVKVEVSTLKPARFAGYIDIVSTPSHHEGGGHRLQKKLATTSSVLPSVLSVLSCGVTPKQLPRVPRVGARTLDAFLGVGRLPDPGLLSEGKVCGAGSSVRSTSHLRQAKLSEPWQVSKGLTSVRSIYFGATYVDVGCQAFCLLVFSPSVDRGRYRSCRAPESGPACCAGRIPSYLSVPSVGPSARLPSEYRAETKPYYYLLSLPPTYRRGA